MVAPLYEYGFIIWGYVSKHIENRITTPQKYAGRIILDIKNPREINSTELFKKLNWLPFSDRITFLRAVSMFKCFNKCSPYLSDKFHNNINRDSGIEIPEAWIPTIRKHNSRSTRRQTYEGTSSVSRNNNEDRNAPITANQRA